MVQIWYFALTLLMADGSLDTQHRYAFPSKERCESARGAMVIALRDHEEPLAGKPKPFRVSPICRSTPLVLGDE